MKIDRLALVFTPLILLSASLSSCFSLSVPYLKGYTTREELINILSILHEGKCQKEFIVPDFSWAREVFPRGGVYVKPTQGNQGIPLESIESVPNCPNFTDSFIFSSESASFAVGVFSCGLPIGSLSQMLPMNEDSFAYSSDGSRAFIGAPGKTGYYDSALRFEIEPVQNDGFEGLLEIAHAVVRNSLANAVYII